MERAAVEYRYASRKGARQAQTIIEAAYRCLARDGYARTSMQRIAEEAGVQKRMLHYYFETRQKLFEQIAAYVGDRMLGPVEDAIEGLDEPSEIVDAGLDRLWRELAAEPELHGVYLGLIAESASDPSLHAAIIAVGDRYRELIHRLIAQVRAQGWTLKLPEETIVIVTIASVQGLALQYLERGESTALIDATEGFKLWLRSLVEQPR